MMRNREEWLPLRGQGSNAGDAVASFYDGGHGVFGALGDHGIGDGDGDKVSQHSGKCRQLWVCGWWEGDARVTHRLDDELCSCLA